jgi:hypothetical protein
MVNRKTLAALGAATAVCLLATVPAVAPAEASRRTTTTVLYDSFNKPGGYTLADYVAKWSNPYGPGEMAKKETRSFAGNRFNVSAAPFQTASDYSVYDHLKYIGISTRTFPVPRVGSVEISSTITASTPGTKPGRVVRGTYPDGSTYEAATLEGQQAAAVMNVIDFSTGQLFDWFVSGSTAFALIERLPSNVTGNTTDPASAEYVDRSKMYTQIIREVQVGPGPHAVAIRFSRDASGEGHVDFRLDGALVAQVDHVGVPLDAQQVDYTGIYPSLGKGEEIGHKVNSLAIGHGLFSLLDAFPFQHPDAPELAVSIPVGERIFGQGAIASFDDFKVKTVSDDQ